MVYISEENTKEQEKKKLLSSLFLPVIFILVLWAIKAIEIFFHTSFASFGILPKTTEGLKGIVLSPLIHGSLEHLYNNSIPLLVLGTSIFYFYKEVAYKVIFYGWIFSGLWIWSMGREAYHIGASSLVYAWAAFIFFSGIIKKNKNLLAISMLVVFLYGNMVWWIFPIEEEISWEGHMMGGLAGLILAFYFKNYGPQKYTPEWLLEDDDTEEDANQDNNDSSITINYQFKSSDNKN